MNTAETFTISEITKLGIEIPDATVDKLFGFIKFLLQENQKINLTAITDYQEALIKHLYDSLIILNYQEFRDAKLIIDIGSGAGIPCFPLAICSPDKEFISIDSTQKKIKFQEQACQILQIGNICPSWSRAEDFIKQPGQRERFDLVLARAVAPVNILAELTLAFVKQAGFAFFYKGPEYQGELQNGKQAISFLGGDVNNTTMVELPGDYGTRSIISIKKRRPTPIGYPRKAGTPQKKPIT